MDNRSLIIDYLTHLIDRASDALREAQDAEGFDDVVINCIMGEISEAGHSVEKVSALIAGDCVCDSETE